MRVRAIVAMLAAWCVLGVPAGAEPAADADDPLLAARARMTEAVGDVSGTAERAMRLAEIAWLEDPAADPLRSYEARSKLISFGSHAVPALRATIRRVDPVHSVDVAAALLELRWSFSSAPPTEYRPALVEVLWFGSTEARRLMIPWSARFRLRNGMLPAIDAALAEPEALLDPTVRFMFRYSDVRARLFLGDMLRDGDGAIQELAAQQLALIGAEALDVLREATLSDDTRVRELAIDALVPVSGVDDLTAMYEYIGRHRETDPPERIERIVRRAKHLEAMLSAQMDAEAASGDD